MPVEIGKIIHELVKDSGLKVKAVANHVNIGESTLYGIYKRKSVDVDKLILFSQLFNKNLFLYYLNEEPLKSMFSGDTAVLMKRIAELEKDLLLKAEKLGDLNQIIENQKKLISLYESNLKLQTTSKKKN